MPLCLRLRNVQQTRFLDDRIVLIQLLLAVGAESQTDSSSEEEDAEFEPQSLQGQSMGISFQSKPLGMSITSCFSSEMSNFSECLHAVLGVLGRILLPD